MLVEDASEDEELGGHLAGRQAEALALTRVLERGCVQLRRVVVASEGSDEGWEAAQLAQKTQPLERRCGSLLDRAIDAFDG
jgi:hypothetical protein